MIILTGASASGKTVTALRLQEKYGLVKAITTTTRDKREGEIDGVHYFYLSKEEFISRLNKGMFVEHSLYNSNYYGCGKDQVADNKVVVLDPNGLHSFLALNDNHVVSFLLLCDENLRKQRMVERGDLPEKITERLKNDVTDFDIGKIGKVDFVICTNHKNIDQVAEEIYKKYKEKLSL